MNIIGIATILIRENCLIKLKLISHSFSEKGDNVIKATSTKEALEIILEEKPDGIVTDIVMLGISGFELCRFIKTNLTNQKSRL